MRHLILSVRVSLMVFYGLGGNGRKEVCNVLKERKQILFF